MTFNNFFHFLTSWYEEQNNNFEKKSHFEKHECQKKDDWKSGNEDVEVSLVKATRKKTKKNKTHLISWIMILCIICRLIF